MKLARCFRLAVFNFLALFILMMLIHSVYLYSIFSPVWNEVVSAVREERSGLRAKVYSLNFNRHRPSTYSNFPEEKPAGTLRIGAFGDSFTYGEEVDGPYDYPTQLQELLNQSGYSHVEVLNFGVGWHGLAQSYLIWDYYRERYSIDISLFGPSGLYSVRDTNFNHTFGVSPVYLHSRFILDERGGLQLIDPVGWSNLTRALFYYLPVPHLRYLRYERHPPFWGDLFLTSGRRPRNPFYYRKDSEVEEAMLIWKKLTEKIVRENPGETIFVMGFLDQSTNLSEISNYIDMTYHFPLEKLTHLSELGNFHVARLYFDLLTGQQMHKKFSFKTNWIRQKTSSPQAVSDVHFSIPGEMNIGLLEYTNFLVMDDTSQLFEADNLLLMSTKVSQTLLLSGKKEVIDHLLEGGCFEKLGGYSNFRLALNNCHHFSRNYQLHIRSEEGVVNISDQLGVYQLYADHYHKAFNETLRDSKSYDIVMKVVFEDSTFEESSIGTLETDFQDILLNHKGRLKFLTPPEG